MFVKNTDLICSSNNGKEDAISENNFGLYKILTVCNLLEIVLGKFVFYLSSSNVNCQVGIPAI